MPTGVCESRTKQGLDDALRQLLMQKPLDQIRVRELTELCAIRRQSFYYHFPDVYVLFEWSLQQERQRLLLRQENCLTWQQAILDLLGHIDRNSSYYQAIMKAPGREGLRLVLSPPIRQLVERTMDYYGRRCGEARDPESERVQLDCWETLVLTFLAGWIQKEVPQRPEELIALMETNVSRSALGAAWQNVSREAEK